MILWLRRWLQERRNNAVRDKYRDSYMDGISYAKHVLRTMKDRPRTHLHNLVVFGQLEDGVCDFDRAVESVLEHTGGWDATVAEAREEYERTYA